jgi:diphthamide synthase subunit DPH2
MEPVALCTLALKIALAILGVVMVLLPTFFLRNYHKKEYVVAVPGFLVLACGLLESNPLSSIELRPRFLLFTIFIAIFIMIYNFILYFEKVAELSPEHKELAHRRYLEYSRTVFWGVIFILVGFIALEIQIGFYQMLDAKTTLSELIPLLIVFLGGSILVFLAFNAKLRDIERLK